MGVVGPRPGVEVLAGIAGGAALLLTGSTWFLGAVTTAGLAVVRYARHFYIVIRTSDEVLLVDCGRRPRPRPGAHVTRMAPTAITMFNGDSDPSVTVGHLQLWLGLGEHHDEARRLSLLTSNNHAAPDRDEHPGPSGPWLGTRDLAP